MSEMPSLNTSIQTVRTLLGDGSLDFSAALAFLNTVPVALLAETAETVRHAREAVSAAPGGDHRHEAVARYMLARVLIALEAERAG